MSKTEKSTESQRKDALSGLSQVISQFENKLLDWHRDTTRNQASKEFWVAVAAHYNFNIIDLKEPQAAKICDKCRKDLE